MRIDFKSIFFILVIAVLLYAIVGSPELVGTYAETVKAVLGVF